MFSKYIKFLPENYKKKSILFILFLVVATILETFSIGLIFPLLEIIFKGELSKNFLIFNSIYDLEIQDKSTFIKNFSIFLIFLYFTKSIYLLYFNYWQLKFSQNVYKLLSCNLFKKYLNNPIKFFYKKNSSELVRNTFLECKSYGQYISIFFKLIVEIMVAFFILTLLIYIEPFKTSIILVLAGIISILYYFFTKNFIYKQGLIRVRNNGAQLKVLNESFSGIKDIKLKSSENFFLKLYESFTNKFVKSAYKQSSIIDAPKYVFDFLFVLGLLLSLIYFVENNKDINSLIPILSMYVITGYRLLPAILRIMNILQQFKGFKPTVEILEKEFTTNNEEKTKKVTKINNFTYNSEIKILDLNFSYDKREKTIENFSTVIKKNSCVGIIGKSGSGKSTLIDLITGLISPEKGEILVDQKNINLNTKEWQSKIGYVSQSVFFLDSSIKENVGFGLEEKDINIELVKKCLADAKIENFVNQLNQGIDTIVGEKGIKLSGGQKQRIAIARELYRKPEILILDEATSGLDEETENQFLEFLDNIKNKLTIIVVSHRKNTLKNCDRIIYL